MTFSIVACDPLEATWGIAVASKFLAVGAVVPWTQAHAGAVATQSFANTTFGPRGLEMMARGSSARQALEALLREDPNREERQVGLVDKGGGSATYTGSACFDWAGGRSGPGYAIQGNILSGEKVVLAMERKFLGTKGTLPSRLYAALLAGDRAGGDRRGRQSAAIQVVKPNGGYAGFNDRWIDYRIDDHADPVPRLGELIQLHGLYFEKSLENERVALSGKYLEQMSAILKREGFLKKGTAFAEAFRNFMGSQNFEERSDPAGGWIDRPVYKYLLKKYGG